jgi:hypothetical protein
MVNMQQLNATLLTGQLEKQRAPGSATWLARTLTPSLCFEFWLDQGEA